MDYLTARLHWPVDATVTQELITLSPSKDGQLCWFFVWMRRTDFAALNFREGVFDLRDSPLGVVALSMDPPRLMHVEVDLNWGTNGWDVDALVEEVDGKWWIPDAEDEVEFTRRLSRVSHAFQHAFNLNFVPCVRRRFKPHDGHVWIIVLMTRTKRQADAIRARTADLQRRIGTSTVQWTLPQCGVFQLVTFSQAMRFWSKLRMDGLTARATLDRETEGSRLFIGDLHEGVTQEELAAAIAQMGYTLTSDVEIISRHWGVTAYVTLASNDEAVDLILRSDSLVVGDPPCRLRIKVARPRDPPAPNYPSDDAFNLLDKQQTEQNGTAHGMTDAQVATVVEALRAVSESALKGVVERLTGSATGLPTVFQAAVTERLTAIETAIDRLTLGVQNSHDGLALRLTELQSAATNTATLQDTRLHRMEQSLHEVLDQLQRLTDTQQGYAYGFDGEFDPDPDVFSSAPPPEPTFATLPAIREEEILESPALGGADVSYVRQQGQPLPDAGSKQEGSGELPPDAVSQQADAGPPQGNAVDVSMADPAKRKAEDPVEEQRTDRDDTWAEELYDSPTPSQNPLDLLSTDTVAQSPLMELSPGYTVAACGRLIRAWNSLSPDDKKLSDGKTATELLKNARLAERRLHVVCDVEATALELGLDQERARAALAAAAPGANALADLSNKENTPPNARAHTDNHQPTEAGHV
jgi:hypothetical protein